MKEKETFDRDTLDAKRKLTQSKNIEKDFFYGRTSKELDYYHINTTIFKEIIPVDVGYEKHSAGKQPFKNKYPYYLLHFVLSGKGSIEFDCKTTLFTKNNIFILPPENEITYIIDTKSDWEYCWINFNGTMAKKILTYLGISETDYYLPTKKRQQIKQCFNEMLKAKGNRATQYFVAMQGLMTLFAIIAEENAKEGLLMTSKENRFEDIFAYINDNLYSPDLSAQSIAKRFFITPSWFSSLFLRNVNMSFKEYINYERVKKATELLLSTELSIKEIAFTVGFNDPLYFSKVFKHYRLVSPQEYKNANTQH